MIYFIVFLVGLALTNLILDIKTRGKIHWITASLIIVTLTTIILYIIVR